MIKHKIVTLSLAFGVIASREVGINPPKLKKSHKTTTINVTKNVLKSPEKVLQSPHLIFLWWGFFPLQDNSLNQIE